MAMTDIGILAAAIQRDGFTSIEGAKCVASTVVVAFEMLPSGSYAFVIFALVYDATHKRPTPFVQVSYV
jgi:hypothetical protein